MDYGIARRQKDIMDSIGSDGSNWKPLQGILAKKPPVTTAGNNVMQPSYMPGGAPVPTAPDMPVMPIDYGSAPKLYDDGGKVDVENKGILGKAADYAKNLYEQAKALTAPEDSEAKSFQEKTRQIEEATPKQAAPETTAPSAAPYPTDLVHPAPYGSHPGEKVIDTREMRKPLAEVQPRMALEPTPESQSLSSSIANTPYLQRPAQMQPSRLYDEGGEVDLDGDGKKDHQKALLSDGERVLSPEEALMYEKEHPEVKEDGRDGAPVDFGGRVLPQTNPPTVPAEDGQVQPDQIAPNPEPNMPQPMGVPQGMPQAAPPQVAPPQARVNLAQQVVPTTEAAGEEPQPYGGEVKQPSYQPGKESTEKAPDIHSVLEQKKAEAAMKGDLMGLGAAIIGQKALEKPVYGGPAVVPGEEVKPGEPVPTGAEAYHKKMSYYQKAYQDALDEFTPEGKERAAGIREAMLNYEKMHPYGAPESARPGTVGRIEHALADVGNVAGAVIAPGIESAIPQSALGRELEQKRAEAMGKEASEQAQQQAATGLTKVETGIKRMGAPTELTGDQNVRTNTSTGKRERAYKYLDGTVRWVPEGKSPLDPDIYTPPKFDLFTGGKPMVGAVPARVAPETPTDVSGVTSEGNTAAAVAAAAATGSGAPQYVYGEKPDAEHMPASKAQIDGYNAAIGAMPALKQDQRAALQFPPNYTPTVADVKDRTALLEKMQTAQNQANQEQFNNSLRQIMSQNQQLLAQARLEDEKLKHDQLYANNAATADSAYASLMSQEVYNESMKTWFKSPSYIKDVALVTNLIEEAKNQAGGFSSLGVDTGIGAMLGGPEGALVGGAVGVISQALRGPANAALETLKKNGVSPEGYQAMQAYFNSIPGRLNFETSVMGVKATAMRMREVMRSLMNTVPSPNTPEDAWDNSFNLYYKPMKNLTERKVKNLDLPQGYSKPERATLGYPEAAREKLPKPNGTKFIGKSTVDGKDYYLDATHKKLGPVYKEPE